MLLKLRYYCSERDITLKYSGNQKLVAVNNYGEIHKVTRIQVLATKPDESPFAKGLTQTKWINIDFNANVEILAELIEKNLRMDHSPPSRFHVGEIYAQPGMEETEPWTLFGHTDVMGLKIVYDSQTIPCYTECCLALAMATHDRLGSHSPLAVFQQEPGLLSLIASNLI